MCRVRTRTRIAAVTTIEGLRAPEVAGRSRARFRFGWRELRGWRLTWSQARRLLVSLILGWAALALTISVLPGVSASTHWDVLLAAALVGVVAPVQPVSSKSAQALTRTDLAALMAGVPLTGTCPICRPNVAVPRAAIGRAMDHSPVRATAQ